MCKGYYIRPEREDVLKSGFYISKLDYGNVNWFVEEVKKIENKIACYFINTERDIILTDEDEEEFKNKNICRFCEKEILIDKVGDHCHLTGKSTAPAHNNCNINVTQKRNNFIPFLLHNFGNHKGHLFFKKIS